MKAVIYKKYGPPSVLGLGEVEKPRPKLNELLIKVHFTTVNRTDCAMLRAKPFIMRFLTGLLRPKNPILGTEFAGEVVETGKDVSSFQIGDKVFGFDDQGANSYAEYLVFNENKGLAKIPEGSSYKEVAASIEGAHYAHNMINKVKIKAGQKVLVNGATGAIGSAAVQLLKTYDVSVTAVGNTKNMELMKQLGAVEVIDYEKEDFSRRIDKFHHIFDAVGKSSFFKCKRLLESKGTYISSELGYMSQNIFLALLTPLFGAKKVRFPIPFDIKRSVLMVKELMEEGKFTPVIDREYTLEEVPKAFEYAESGQKTGNLIVTIAD